jgi:hypothetical protein
LDASIDALAKREGVSPSLVTRIVRLAFLAPDIVDAILKGQQPPGLTARELMNGPAPPLAWREQRQRLGFPARPAP